jgi:hypothetical protein
VFGGRAGPGAALALIPGIPLLAAGQVTTIVVLNARSPRRGGGPRSPMSAPVPPQFSPRAILFPELPRQAAYGVLGLALTGWLAGITAFPALSQGGPSGGSDRNGAESLGRDAFQRI